MPDLPEAHRRFLAEFPALAEAYSQMGAAVHENSPFDPKMRQLIKLALAIGARHEGAVHSHARRALEAGATEEELNAVVALAVTTLGMPNTVAAYTWVGDVLPD